MIEGTVNAHLEAVVTLPLLGPIGADAGSRRRGRYRLQRRPGLAAYIKWRTWDCHVVGDGEAVLADGSEAAFDVYGVTMLWDGQLRYVETGAVGVNPLVGMAMLENHDLSIHVREGGRVVIQAGA